MSEAQQHDRQDPASEPDGRRTGLARRLRRGGRRGTAVALVVGLGAVLAGTAVASRHRPTVELTSAELETPTGTATTPTATTPTTPTSTTTPPAPATPTKLVGLPPANISNGTASVTIELSAPPAPGSPRPMFSPAIAGSWHDSGNSESFTAASTLQPCAEYTLTIWAQTTATGHKPLGQRRKLALKVACPPVAGMQEALARLGYLPAVFKPRYGYSVKPGRMTRREAAVHAYHPPRGRLAPSPSDAPPVQIGTLDATTRGALTVYQEDHGIEVTGEPDTDTWNSVLSNEAIWKRDPKPYTWVSVSEAEPETLEVHEGRRVALTTLANTGVAGAETELGVFPIYSRLESTTMTGTDPDGVHYVAPDVPWVNYFNGGDAVHGYPRASYGYPQSNGCVELPIEAAHHVFDMLELGDIVVVR